jgi:hypothetical protein
VRIDGNPVVAILDSGSELNILNSAFRSDWTPDTSWSGQDMDVITANGQQRVRAVFTSRLVLQIPVGDKTPTAWTGELTVLHMPHVRAHVILGAPFLVDTRAKVDFQKEAVTLITRAGDTVNLPWATEDVRLSRAHLLLTAGQAAAFGECDPEAAVTWRRDDDLQEDCKGRGQHCQCAFHSDRRLLKKQRAAVFLVVVTERQRTAADDRAEAEELEFIKAGLLEAGFMAAGGVEEQPQTEDGEARGASFIARKRPATEPLASTPGTKRFRATFPGPTGVGATAESGATAVDGAASRTAASEPAGAGRKRSAGDLPADMPEPKRGRTDWAQTFSGAPGEEVAAAPSMSGGRSGPTENWAREPGDANGMSLNDMAVAFQRMVRLPATERDRRRELLQVLFRHHRSFVNRLPALAPRRAGFDTTINFLPTARTIRAAKYRMSMEEQAVMRLKVEELVEKGYWTPGMTPYSVTAMVVLKPGKRGDQLSHWRLVEDYRLVNACVSLPANTMPSMDEIFAQLATARFISTFDLQSGYDQLRQSADFRDKVGILADGQIFKSEVTSQGYLGSATTFQNMMNGVIRGHLETSDGFGGDLRDFLTAYLDDVFAFSSDFTTHLQHLDRALQRLADNQLFINIDKARIGAGEAVVLGFTVGRGRKLILPDRLAGIRDTPPPATRDAMRRWLGVVNFLRSFIPGFPALTAHQRQVLARTHGEFGLTDQARAEFERLKQQILDSPGLRLPDRTKPFFLTTDGAGSSGIGAALWQRDEDGRLAPVAFFSRAFEHKSRSSQFSSNEVETFAALEAMRAFRVYLQSSSAPFILLTDATFLEHLFSTDTLTARLQRLIDGFSDFKFRVFHFPGASNFVADFLSRQYEEPARDGGAGVDAREASVLVTTRAAARREARETADTEPTPSARSSERVSGTSETQAAGGLTAEADRQSQSAVEQAVRAEEAYPRVAEHLAALLPGEYQSDSFFRSVWRHTEPGAAEHHHHHARRFLRKDGLLYLRSEPPRLCLPMGMVRQRLVRVMHAGPEANHAGARTVLAKLATSFFWPRMLETLMEAQLACMTCQVNKPARRQLHGWYQPFLTTGQCFLDICIDLATALPATPVSPGSLLHHDAALIIVDRFSHAVFIEPCSQHVTGPEIVEALDRRVYLAHGAFRSVTADGDVRFTSGFELALQQRGAKLRQSSKDHPQSNGLAEKSVGLAVAFLRNFVWVNQRNWPALLPQAELALANRYIHHLGCTPYFLLHGHEFRARSTTLFRREPPAEVALTRGAVFEHASHLEELRAAALDRLLDVQEKLAERLNAGASAFEVGDWVLVQSGIVGDPASRVQDCRKMGHRWSGPFQVVAVRGGNAYELRLHAQTRAHNVVNIEHLKRYEGPEPTGPGPLPGVGQGDMFLVEDVVGHRQFRGTYQFLVKWVGWLAPRDDTWLPPSALVSRDFRCTIFEEYVRLNNLPPELLRFPGNDTVKFVGEVASTSTTGLPLQCLWTSGGGRVSDSQGRMGRLLSFLEWKLEMAGGMGAKRI